jgi:hypothetical protein
MSSEQPVAKYYNISEEKEYICTVHISAEGFHIYSLKRKTATYIADYFRICTRNTSKEFFTFHWQFQIFICSPSLYVYY